MTELRPLNELMKSEFVLAKRWLRADALFRWLVAAVAVVAVLSQRLDDVWIASLGFMGPIAAILAREIGAHYFAKGERLRRLYLLQQGLGVEPDENELLEALGRTANVSNSEPVPAGSYYTSELSNGFQRLLHLLQESAFWTQAQARLAMVVHYVVFGSGVAAIVLFAYMLLPAGSPSAASPSIDFGKLFATLVLFFVAGPTLTSARAYQKLTTTAGEVMRTAGALRREDSVDPIALHKVLSTYDAALGGSLPLPGYTYRLLQKRLNAAWRSVSARDGSQDQLK